MDKSQAIKSLSAELESSYTDLYAFQPVAQTEKFFVGEAVIVAAATVLLTAFLKGLESGLEPRMKIAGEALAAWIDDRLESLFKAPPPVDGELDRTAAVVRDLVAKLSAGQQSQIAEEVQKLIEDTLRKHGVPQDRAAAIAASTRQSGIGLATSAVTGSPKTAAIA